MHAKCEINKYIKKNELSEDFVVIDKTQFVTNKYKIKMIFEIFNIQR